MNKTLIVVFFAVFMTVFFVFPLKSNSASVNAYYDEKNDWFVFEWINKEYGNMRSIYDPPNKVKPVISAYLVKDDKEIYQYSYTIRNNKEAMQLLSNIYISHMAPVFEVRSPYPEKEWMSGEYRNYNIWGWFNDKKIIPGSTEPGFSFKSEGLPIIVDAKFFGLQRIDYNGPSEDYDTLEVNREFGEKFKEFQDKYPEKFKKITLRTVGPGEIPKDFNALTFIDSIISVKHEAAKLGWITNDGIIKSLDAKLDNAKKAIAGNNMTSAKNLLEAFVKEVEAQGCPTIDDCPKGKHLTSEAYALLKYNALYLLDRL